MAKETEDKTRWFFHLTRDIDVPVQVRIETLELDILADDWREARALQEETAASVPCPPQTRGETTQPHFGDSGGARRLSVYVTACLQDDYGTIGAPMHTKVVDSSQTSGQGVSTGWCVWDTLLKFPLRVKDLQPSARVSFVVRYSSGELGGWRVLGSCVLPLFHESGRLQAGEENVPLQIGRELGQGIDERTRGDFKERSTSDCEQLHRLRSLQRQLKAYESGQVERLGWLDGLSIGRGVVDKNVLELKTALHIRHGLELRLALPRYAYDAYYCDVLESKDAASGPGAQMHASSRQGLKAAAAIYVTISAGASAPLMTFVDPEANKESPTELMAQKMARSQVRRSEKEQHGSALQPNAQERRALDRIVAYSPNQELDQDEKNLVWRYRHALSSDRNALTTFLHCVDWADAAEAAQAGAIMESWARMDVGDALEMLSPSFKAEQVRKHAVAFLRTVSDDEINSIVLQLVQALRFETEDVSDLSKLLLERARGNKVISSSVFWHLCSELEDETFGSRAQVLQTELLSELDVVSNHDELMVESSSIPLQLNLLARLRHLQDSVKAYRTADAKTERLRALLAPGGSCEDLASFVCPNPLIPTMTLRGVVPSKCSVFRSNVKPTKFTWRADSGHDEVSFIYKKGDDLRQDQLVMQIFALMDRLLKKEHLDLQITTYGILPTSLDDGLIEFVPDASPLSAVMQEYGSILGFLSRVGPSPASNSTYSTNSLTSPACGEAGTTGLTLDDKLYNYIRSCAGYVVFTHIMGIGDRHLDNIMLTSDGRLFHIDFGYILGADPKFKQAPLVLTRAMVDAMGDEYNRFVELACEALNILRKSAGLLLSVIHVMAQSSIPDVRSEMAMLKVQEKLRLDLSDEAAAKSLEALLLSAQYAVLPKLAELQHGLAKNLVY
jgi:phosphatidylinositol 3-kinase